MTTPSAVPAQRLPWPLLPTLGVYLAGTLISAVLVPQLDGANGPRLRFFLILSALYWGRFAVACWRRENRSPYKLYWAIMLLTGPAEIVAEGLLVRA